LWQNKLSGRHSYRWIIAIDTDDETMCNPEMDAWLAKRENESFTVLREPHTSKIDACNSGLPVLRNTALDYDIAVLVSDDMLPLYPCYDEIIAADMQKYFADLDGCVHYDDGLCAHQQCIVLSIVGRELMEKMGNRFYWPEYRSLWSDTEFTQVVYHYQKAVYIDRVIIQHAWKQNGTDETYRASDADFGRDKEVYFRRQKEGFPGAIRTVTIAAA
jgi:hypothetical protein